MGIRIMGSNDVVSIQSAKPRTRNQACAHPSLVAARLTIAQVYTHIRQSRPYSGTCKTVTAIFWYIQDSHGQILECIRQSRPDSGTYKHTLRWSQRASRSHRSRTPISMRQDVSALSLARARSLPLCFLDLCLSSH